MGLVTVIHRRLLVAHLPNANEKTGKESIGVRDTEQAAHSTLEVVSANLAVVSTISGDNIA